MNLQGPDGWQEAMEEEDKFQLRLADLDAEEMGESSEEDADSESDGDDAKEVL